MKVFTGPNLDRIEYPLGGLGAGSICIKGTGALGGMSIRNAPGIYWDPMMYAAVTVLGNEPVSRVVEAPIPGMNITAHYNGSGLGLMGKNFGLPRFSRGEFSTHFPFASLRLSDNQLPIEARITAWSPFIPGNADKSSLPYAAVEYTFENISSNPLNCVFYFSAENFMRKNDDAFIRVTENGFILEQPEDPNDCSAKGAFSAEVDHAAFVDTAWFRGGWFDTLTMQWNAICQGKYENKVHHDDYGKYNSGGLTVVPFGSGATLAVPFSIGAFGKETIKLRLSWYVPGSNMRTILPEPEKPLSDREDYYQPWYSGQFADIDEIAESWKNEYDSLRELTFSFMNSFYDTNIPEEIVEAVAANLTILKSPTVQRLKDGRFHGFEGSGDNIGLCPGSTTHVWNYQQALSHLFPSLERTLRHTEFFDSQDERGHQNFHFPVPVQPVEHTFHAASDGQLGGIVKVYREWRISGDTKWLRNIWPKIRQSLDYCIATWDPDHIGALVKAHHNTYDIEFWGADSMCTGYYLSALKAACEMGATLGDDTKEYSKLYAKGRIFYETELFNGEYFYQKTEKASVDAVESTLSYAGIGYSPELKALIEAEGPRYQYGTGCLSDAVVGIWLGEMCGLSDVIDEDKLVSTLRSIYKYNMKHDLSTHSNPQRPGYALNNEGGLLLCTWPHGGKPSLPFIYSDEVWTGIEYQVASHLISKGMLQEGLDIVRTLRQRYDGTRRNPYCEFECGYWYARAMASYALIEAYTGVRYDAVSKTLYAKTKNADNFRCFLSTESGFGTVSVKNGKIEFTPAYGSVDIRHTVIE